MFKKIIIIVVLVAAIGIAIVYGFNKSNSSPSSLASTGITPADTVSGSPNAVSSSFLSSLLGLQTITLDTSVLQNPAFGKLVDNTVVVTDPGTEGRTDPFAPVAGAPSSQQ